MKVHGMICLGIIVLLSSCKKDKDVSPDDTTTSTTISIEEGETTELSSSKALAWTHRAATSTASVNFGSLKLQWLRFREKPTFITIGKGSSTKLVSLSDSYSSITTEGDLKKKIDGATSLTSYDVKTPGSLDIVLGVISEGQYYLVHLTNVKETVERDDDGSKRGITTVITGTYKTEVKVAEEQR